MGAQAAPAGLGVLRTEPVTPGNAAAVGAAIAAAAAKNAAVIDAMAMEAAAVADA